MRQRGRKSVANLMTLRVDGEPARLQPPRGLSKAEQHQFNDLINATSPKHFAESDLPLLVTYVQATVMARSAIRKNCRLGKGDARAGGAGDEIAAGTAVAVRCQNDGAADAADTVGAAAVGALTMPRQRSTGERYVMWIESYCVRPVAGPERGQRVKLTDAQKETVRRIYDQGDNLESSDH